MSSTPQDVTNTGEGVVAKSLRYAEWVVAGLCAWSLLYATANLLAIQRRRADQQYWNFILSRSWDSFVDVDSLAPDILILLCKSS